MCQSCSRSSRVREYEIPSPATTNIRRPYVWVREVFGDCGELVDRYAISSVYYKDDLSFQSVALSRAELLNKAGKKWCVWKRTERSEMIGRG